MAVQNPQRRNPWEPAVPEPQIRLTHADRDAVAEVLREAYSQGQLDEDEFGDRLDRAMRAKISGDLVPLTSDLGISVSPGGTGRAPRTDGARQDGKLTTDNPMEKVGAAAGHLSAFFLPFLAPLVLLLVGGELSPYLRRQAMEALNFQLFCLVSAIVSVLLVWLVLPALVLVGVFLGWFILPIIAAAGALMGRDWRYPLVYRLIKEN